MGGVLEYWERRADLRGKNYGFLHDVSRFSTILRTDQGLNSAMLRIFTGKTNFWRRRARNEKTGKYALEM
jgi:hypothetical protein